MEAVVQQRQRLRAPDQSIALQLNVRQRMIALGLRRQVKLDQRQEQVVATTAREVQENVRRTVLTDQATTRDRQEAIHEDAHRIVRLVSLDQAVALEAVTLLAEAAAVHALLQQEVARAHGAVVERHARVDVRKIDSVIHAHNTQGRDH